VTAAIVDRAKAVADDAAHLLLVDDDRRIRDLLSRYLREQGYRISTAESAAAARAAMQTLAFDLIVLDLMMPGESGLEFARALRAGSDVPILMLTARSELDDRLEGLAIGADDYLGKPFDPKELLFRIANILRRVAVAQPAAPAVAARVRFGPFVFHLDRGELMEGETPIRLTDREREMMRLLAGARDGIVGREALAEIHSGSNERTVDVLINRLRRKIERDPSEPRYLQTQRGVGYRLMIDG
jgi:two-component system phosphate regulon response regulator OmpR